MEKQYNIDWVQSESELPRQGSVCPKCTTGEVVSSQYGGMWCKGCKWKWKISKYSEKKSGGSNEVLNALRECYKAIEVNKEKLDIILKAKIFEDENT